MVQKQIQLLLVQDYFTLHSTSNGFSCQQNAVFGFLLVENFSGVRTLGIWAFIMSDLVA